MDKGMNLHDLAAKHGNPNCRKAFSLAGLEYKWSYDERLEIVKKMKTMQSMTIGKQKSAIEK